MRDLLLQLAEQVGRRLRAAAVRATVVRLKLRHPDFTTLSRQRKVAATADDLELHRVACELLAECWPGRPGVRLLGVTGASLVGADAPIQRDLFAPDADRRAKVLKAMDAIRDRHGEGAVRHGGERRRTNPWGPDAPQ